jgi:ABC-type multidrug transport system fused ATPase/permease subunit
VQVVQYKQALRATGMLIATTMFDDRDLKLLKNIGIDEVWDIQGLSAKAEISAELATELAQLLRDAELGYAGVPVGVQTEIAESLSPEDISQPRGEQLIEKLQRTQAGKMDSRKFEELCCDSVRYVFGEHLGQFQKQNRVEEGFHYMDLIARLSPRKTGVFWVSLAQDFRCRYVVFEFKNYEKAISQNQIYSTEKYLYPNALRSVAIIIARNGSDISFDFPVTALVGPNGAGKSTVLAAASCIYPDADSSP